MFKEIKLPFNISFMEALSVFFFITLGYLFIYRYSYYNTLGISWYITSITPTQVLSSSFKIFMNLLFGVMIFFAINQFLKLTDWNKKNVKVIIMILIYALWFILMFGIDIDIYYKLNSFVEVSELSLISIVHYTLFSFFISFIISNSNSLKKDKMIVVENVFIPENVFTPKDVLDKYDKFTKELLFFNYVVIAIVVFATPVIVGSKDALQLLKNREKNLNSVVLTNDKNNWLLLDISGDKVLLIQAKNPQDNKNEFKLVEYKEVKSITATSIEDMDKSIAKLIRRFEGK